MAQGKSKTNAKRKANGPARAKTNGKGNGSTPAVKLDPQKLDPKFHFMTFMPYAHLPADHKKYDSLWVDYSNANYDPAKGKALYDRYINEFELADQLGFDGIVVNEHHSSIYSMMPAPNLIASALIQRTQNAKICVWGTPPNLEYPNRLAEEYAMLDVMSGGRLEVAFPLGTGMEYWSHPISPAKARGMHEESIEIILKCWTQDGPVTHDGRHYHYRYLNPWPRPMQKPHPKMYLVGSGSPETMEMAGRLGVGYTVAFFPHKQQIELNENVRRIGRKYGHEIGPDKFPMGAMVFVAETDKQAEEEYRPHIQYFFENCLRTTPNFLAPPGYMSIEKMRRRLELSTRVHGGFDWDFMTSQFRICAGSPETVATKIAGWMTDVQASVVNCQAHLGDLPHWKTVKNLTMLAQEVFPRVREKLGVAPKHGARAQHATFDPVAARMF